MLKLILVIRKFPNHIIGSNIMIRHEKTHIMKKIITLSLQYKSQEHQVLSQIESCFTVLGLIPSKQLQGLQKSINTLLARVQIITK